MSRCRLTYFGRLAADDVPAACVTVTVCPATVSVPVAGDEVMFRDAVNVTVPLPLPLAPPVTVSHVVLVRAVHVHPAVVLTLTEYVPAAAAIDIEVGVTV